MHNDKAGGGIFAACAMGVVAIVAAIVYYIKDSSSSEKEDDVQPEKAVSLRDPLDDETVFGDFLDSLDEESRMDFCRKHETLYGMLGALCDEKNPRADSILFEDISESLYEVIRARGQKARLELAMKTYYERVQEASRYLPGLGPKVFNAHAGKLLGMAVISTPEEHAKSA